MINLPEQRECRLAVLWNIIRRSELTKSESTVFATLFMATFAAMLGMGIIGPLMPIYAENMGATGIWLGVVFSAFGLARFIFNPHIGALSDRKGRKAIIRIGLLLYFIISICYILATSVFQLTFVRFVHGIASAMVVPVALAYVGDICAEKKEGATFGTFNVAFMLGMGFGPLLGGVVNDKYGTEAVFLSMGALTFLSFLLVILFLPESRYRKKRKRGGDWSLLRNRKMLALFVLRMVNFLGRGSIITFLAVLAYDMGISISQIGILLAVNLFTMALLQPVFGRLVDRYDKILLILIGSVLTIISLAFISLSSSFSEFLLLNCLMGVGGAIIIPTSLAIITMVGRSGGMGSAMGLQDSAISGGMVAGPLISGAIMEIIGIEWVFIVGAFICLAGTITFFALIHAGKDKKGLEP